jgi:hypothetical protein
MKRFGEKEKKKKKRKRKKRGEKKKEKRVEKRRGMEFKGLKECKGTLPCCLRMNPLIQPCAIRHQGRCMFLEVNHFFMPLHMSTILNLLILEPLHYGLFSHDHWLGR